MSLDLGHVLAINQVHHQIHKGTFRTISAVMEGLADGAFVRVLIRVAPDVRMHVRLAGTTSANMIGRLFEDPLTSADGTGILSHARNRYSSVATTTLCFTGPTVTSTGTKLVETFIPGGSGGNAVGGSASSFEEWVLTDGDYLAEIENISGNNNQIAGLTLDFYEPTRIERI